MENETDVFEWRRFAHWDTGSAKARFAAFVLWQMSADPGLSDMAKACGQQGDDASLALLEAFRRESAVALELVVKAVIASKLRARSADPAMEGVPATHDLPKLWSAAGLPTLPHEDEYRLQLAKQILMWSGRYATPRTVKAWEEENKAFATLEDPVPGPERFVTRKSIALGWTEFDRLYQIAFGFLQGVRPLVEPNRR